MWGYNITLPFVGDIGLPYIETRPAYYKVLLLILGKLPSFPEEVRIDTNHFWYNWTLICLFVCARNGRWLPRQSNSHSRVPEILFLAKLATYTMYYVSELSLTNMWHGNFHMAIHHVMALLLFATFLGDGRQICVTAMVPFLIHEELSRSEERRLDLLVWYNVSMYTVGLVGHVINRRGMFSCTALPSLCVMIALWNVFASCRKGERGLDVFCTSGWGTMVDGPFATAASWGLLWWVLREWLSRKVAGLGWEVPKKC
ncbi:uncharacterized protein SPPG_09021 [Spizellomyces punctatus DAOM BR117]|uniref:TLC domain-containing protein n=1 Tax=Spizellomyces punctatus (strain DAOM BR117) TaxID=645134 RepID=A0A0L0HLA8_SPIPD|nr:uncharacterized protein SPPG_09021 [Spizellomyces punctatus DAOM BR117]KND01912.1 hypothetical protein SPPG_09021 [Spizellomyces punctatus DAOM BR117]|eukprot:XP_016609951.1 hypothetical protein SPPG_09021 [Spizellomyces punctatus DAOM BR117]